jgi:hypothetical protein
LEGYSMLEGISSECTIITWMLQFINHIVTLLIYCWFNMSFHKVMHIGFNMFQLVDIVV